MYVKRCGSHVKDKDTLDYCSILYCSIRIRFHVTAERCSSNSYGWECSEKCYCTDSNHCDRFTGPTPQCNCQIGFFNDPFCEPGNEWLLLVCRIVFYASIVSLSNKVSRNLSLLCYGQLYTSLFVLLTELQMCGKRSPAS